MAMPFNSPLMMDQELWSVGHVLETQHTSFSRYKLKIAFQWLEIEASHFIKKPSKVHFHWGSAKGQGSEHTIEGKQHDLEMHMVHTNTAYETDEAAKFKDGYLVVGVLFDEAKRNKIRVKAIHLF